MKIAQLRRSFSPTAVEMTWSFPQPTFFSEISLFPTPFVNRSKDFSPIMKFSLSFSSALLAFLSLVVASSVIDLDADNFDKVLIVVPGCGAKSLPSMQIVGGSKPALVELYVITVMYTVQKLICPFSFAP